MTAQSTLEDLLVSEEELNEGVLAEVLSPYVQIGESTGAFVPTEEFGSLKGVQQTAVVLLYRKAANALGLADEEGATPSEISDLSGMNHNTVKAAVRELDDQNLVENDSGTYSVKTYNYGPIRDLIQGE